MPDTTTAGGHAARALLDAMPDKPLYLDMFWDQPRTPTYDAGRPFVVLAPNSANVAVHARPHERPAPDIGETIWVRYPSPAEIAGPDYQTRLRVAVEAKLAEIEAIAERSSVAEAAA